MEYWIWLTQIGGLGPIIEKRLLEHFQTPKAIYDAPKEELLTVSGVGEKLANSILNSRSLSKAFSIMEACDKKAIKLLTYNDALYPSIAKEDREAPILLYYRGEIRDSIEGIGIVGSRRTSDYGKKIVLELGDYLGECNVPVISGMAKGIDGYAHTAVLKAKGYTLAFLGCGVDVCYPSEHRSLMEKIIESGAVISKYPPGTRAKTQYFPQRNALIASWSKKIVVVEAADKSGALITAEIGQKLGREIYAVPHSIYSKTGVGANKLLLKGATPYLEKGQLINIKESKFSLDEKIAYKVKEVKEKRSNKKVEDVQYSAIEAKIITCLEERPKTIEQISFETGINQVQLLEELPVMELEEKIRVLSGGRYCIA